MKQKIRGKCTLLLLLALLTGVVASGCTIGDRQIYFASRCGWHTVFKIGEMACKQEEAKVYLANYKNLYGHIYGTDLWDGTYDSRQMEQSIKDAAMAHLVQVYSLNVYAADHEIVLDEAEQEKVEEAAETYFASLSRKERRYMGVSKRDICAMYQRYALAEKVYGMLMESVDENVSEDEARIMEACVLFVTDEDLAKEIDIKLKNGATFERLASTYNESDSIHATFGRGTYDSAVEDVVFQLDDEEISPMIAADGGYYFFQCVDKYNEELSEENKENVIEQRQAQAIQDMIAAQEKQYYSDFHTSLWDRITVADEELNTGSFFSTLDSLMDY